jgi:hypothetical protein
VLVALAFGLVLLAGSARADLRGTLHGFVERNGALVRNGVFDALTPVVERLALRGTDLPPAPTSLGFSYRFDLESGAMIRERGPLGSMFLERPRTLGRGVVAAGALYEHATLTDYDGSSLADEVRLESGIRFTDGSSVRHTLSFTELDVTLDLVDVYATYGVRDDLDVSLLLPIMVTGLDLRAVARTVERDGGEVTARSVRIPAARDTAAGVGDVRVRSKWRIIAGPLEVGALLGLRAPSGATRDFQGLGLWVVEPELLLAKTFGENEVHGVLGFGIAANDLQRSNLRYGVGGSLQPLAGIAVFADVLGRSDLAADEFTVTSPNDAFVRSQFIDQFQRGSPEPVAGGFRTSNRIPRLDQVDMNVGVKWSPVQRGFLFASVLLPLTSDGLRAVAVPAVGAQWSF